MSLNDFVVLAKVGEGAYSSVHKVKRISDGNLYALKKVILTPPRSKWVLSRTRKKKTHSTKSVSSPPSAPTSSSSIKRPSSIPKITLCV